MKRSSIGEEEPEVAQDTMETFLGGRAGNHEVGVQQISLLRFVQGHLGKVCSD
jgi:hypothetical protein